MIVTALCFGTLTLTLFSMSNICEDSLLASPLILDLTIVAEMMTRVNWRTVSADGIAMKYKGFHSVLSILSYMLKVS